MIINFFCCCFHHALHASVIDLFMLYIGNTSPAFISGHDEMLSMQIKLDETDLAGCLLLDRSRFHEGRLSQLFVRVVRGIRLCGWKSGWRAANGRFAEMWLSDYSFDFNFLGLIFSDISERKPKHIKASGSLNVVSSKSEKSCSNRKETKSVRSDRLMESNGNQSEYP